MAPDAPALAQGRRWGSDEYPALSGSEKLATWLHSIRTPMKPTETEIGKQLRASPRRADDGFHNDCAKYFRHHPAAHGVATPACRNRQHYGITHAAIGDSLGRDPLNAPSSLRRIRPYVASAVGPERSITSATQPLIYGFGGLVVPVHRHQDHRRDYSCN